LAEPGYVAITTLSRNKRIVGPSQPHSRRLPFPVLYPVPPPDFAQSPTQALGHCRLRDQVQGLHWIIFFQFFMNDKGRYHSLINNFKLAPNPPSCSMLELNNLNLND
jgi:hypothetical protein